MKTLRFGILSTASINEYGFLPHIKHVPCTELSAVASRDFERAAKYAKKKRIGKAYGDYESLLADGSIDCVYIPLPVSMHAEWSIKAMEAGKHVLCEKPMAANAAQARRVAFTARATGMTFAEAFHYRYHPLAGKIEEIVRGGEIGEVRKIYSQLGVPLMDKGKVQFDPELAGGALLDVGCYPVSFSRWIAGSNTAEVTEAHAKMTESGVDGKIRATLMFDNGVEAKIVGSLVEFMPPFASIKGTEGELHVVSPFAPSAPNSPVHIDIYLLLVRRGWNIRSVRVARRVTYHCQLDAFCAAVRSGRRLITNADEAVRNMELIDAIYEKAEVSRPSFE